MLPADRAPPIRKWSPVLVIQEGKRPFKGHLSFKKQTYDMSSEVLICGGVCVPPPIAKNEVLCPFNLFSETIHCIEQSEGVQRLAEQFCAVVGAFTISTPNDQSFYCNNVTLFKSMICSMGIDVVLPALLHLYCGHTRLGLFSSIWYHAHISFTAPLF